MKTPSHTPSSSDRLSYGLECPLRQAARVIARSRCPEVTRHAVLMRFQQLVAEEKTAMLHARARTAEWQGHFAA